MSVDSTARKQTFDMDGVTVDFVFTFKGLKGNESDIKCAVVSGSTLTLLTYETDYSVLINANADGGVVTVEDAEDEGIELLVWRETTNTQESDYEDYNQFPADTVERDFDRRTLKSQELEDDISRAVKASIGSDLTDLDLPLPSAGKALKWNATEDGLENSTDDIDGITSTAGTYATIAQAAAAAALVSEIAAATSASLALASEYAAGTYATISQSYSTIAQETVDGKVPYTGATTDLNMGSNGYVGPVTIKQNSDTVAISHDGTDAYFKTSDGYFRFETNEGTNTTTYGWFKGKGTGSAGVIIQDGSSSTYTFSLLQTDAVSNIQGGTGVTSVVVNDEGRDIDFRVESDTITNAFVVDGATGGITMGGLKSGANQGAAGAAAGELWVDTSAANVIKMGV